MSFPVFENPSRVLFLCVCGKTVEVTDVVREAERKVEARWTEIARTDRENARADESKIMTRMALEAIDDAYERGKAAGLNRAIDLLSDPAWCCEFCTINSLRSEL